MADAAKKCMVCAKAANDFEGRHLRVVQDRIRREAMGEQASISDRADRELSRHGVAPVKK